MRQAPSPTPPTAKVTSPVFEHPVASTNFAAASSDHLPQNAQTGAAPASPVGAPSGGSLPPSSSSPTTSAAEAEALRKRLRNLRGLRTWAVDVVDQQHLDKQIAEISQQLAVCRPVHDRLRDAEKQFEEAQIRLDRNVAHVQKAQESLEIAKEKYEAAKKVLTDVRNEVAAKERTLQNTDVSAQLRVQLHNLAAIISQAVQQTPGAAAALNLSQEQIQAVAAALLPSTPTHAAANSSAASSQAHGATPTTPGGPGADVHDIASSIDSDESDSEAKPTAMELEPYRMPTRSASPTCEPFRVAKKARSDPYGGLLNEAPW